jgi:hypothetical protein
MWKRHYGLSFPPQYVQVKPTEGDEALLEQQGYLVRNEGKLKWTVGLPELMTPTTAPPNPRPRQSPYTPSQRPGRSGTPANRGPMPYNQGSDYVQQPFNRQGPPASLEIHQQNRANEFGFTMPNRSGDTTLRAPRPTLQTYAQRHSPYPRPPRPSPPRSEIDAH